MKTVLWISTNGVKRNQSKFQSRRVRGFAGALFFALVLPLAALAAESGKDSGPTLLSTSGPKPKPRWDSLDQIKRAAEAGDPAACNEYAILLEQGQALPKDFERALHFYELAAAAGVRESNFRLATLYHDGLGVKQDYPKAFEYYKVAALKGDALAQYNVGSMLVSARGMKRDWMEGLAWVIVARQNGANADGEKQIRDHLANRPEVIAAAEKRALEIRDEIAKPNSPAAKVVEPSAAPSGRVAAFNRETSDRGADTACGDFRPYFRASAHHRADSVTIRGRSERAPSNFSHLSV